MAKKKLNINERINNRLLREYNFSNGKIEHLHRRLIDNKEIRNIALELIKSGCSEQEAWNAASGIYFDKNPQFGIVV